MRFWIIVLAAALSLGCAQWRSTVGCYSETELGISYDHKFGDSSISGGFNEAHGRDDIHSGSGVSGDLYAEDHVGISTTIHFMPGACP